VRFSAVADGEIVKRAWMVTSVAMATVVLVDGAR